MGDISSIKPNGADGTEYNLKDAAARSNIVADEKMVRNAVGFSGKNLLPSFGIGMSDNGVTMTVDENGVCTFNGTATTATAFMVCSKTQLKEIVDKLKGRTVYCTGLPDNVPSNCRIEFQGLVTDGVSTQVTSATPRPKITISDYSSFDTISVGIIIAKDTVCDNLKFYPMMYDEDVLDGSYEPFGYPVKERLAEQDVLGVKNFIPFPYHDGMSKEINGITYTVNADGTILANGTATDGDANFVLSTYSESEIPEGRFYLSDEAGFNIADGNRAYLCMARRKNGGTTNTDYDTSLYSSHKRQVVVDYTQYNEFNFFIYVMNGTTLDNVVFKPMLRYATYADDAYVPPAWTNRQLTVGKADLDSSGKVKPSELPVATTTNLGAIKPDGTSITVDANGVASASGGGGGTTVVPNPSGTATGDLTKLQIGNDIYGIHDTTYSDATTSASGLMSSTDKSKLNGIANNANNYSLPTAASNTKGGVKVGTGLAIASEVLSVPSLNYSTSEQAVGKWTDGSTIYQKTFTGTMPTVATQGTEAYDSGSLGFSLKTLIGVECTVKPPSDAQQALYATQANRDAHGRVVVFGHSHSSNADTYRLYSSMTTWNSGTYILTIKYVKN